MARIAPAIVLFIFRLLIYSFVRPGLYEGQLAGKMKRMVLAAFFLLNASSSAGAGGDLDDKLRSPLTLAAYVEGYYSHDFNEPVNNAKPPFLTSFSKSNQPAVNLAFIKASYAAPDIRANFALAAGTYMNANYAAEPGILGHLYEGNIALRLSGENKLWLEAGVFPSHIGFESATGKNNWTLTRSMAAENTPYFESGVRIDFTSADDKWFLSGLVLNGWQHIKPVDGNTLPAFGTQITYRPSPEITLNSSTFAGSDKPDSHRQMRYFHNFYGIFKLNEQLAATVGFDIGVEQKSKHSGSLNTWFNPTVILRYVQTPRTAVAVRAEYYNDRQGVMIASAKPHGFRTWGFSANFDYNITDNLLWRLEARTLLSKDDIFAGKNGTSRDSATFFTTSIVAHF